MKHVGIHRQVCSFSFLGLLTAGSIITQAPAIAIQLIPPPPLIAQLASPQLPSVDPFQPPPQVTQIGGTEVAPVRLQGETLFNIASPAVLDRKNLGNQLPVEIRAKRIEENLQYIISIRWAAPFDFFTTIYDPKTLSIQVDTLSDQTILTATDAARTEPQIIMTITEPDAEYNGLPKAELATKWRDRLQTVLVAELEERSSTQLILWGLFSLGLMLLLGLISGIPWLMLKWFNHLQRRLKAKQAGLTPHSAGETEPLLSETSEPQRSQLLRLFKRRDWIALQLNLIGCFRWFLIWSLVIAWVVGIAFIIDQFPFTPLRWTELLIHPLEILLIWFVAGIINRAGNIAIDRSITFWKTQHPASADLQRRSLRISTIAHVLKGLKTFLVYLIAVIWILNSLDFSTSSILAFGAIIGFAISLASQNLIRDLVNGFLILLEDQYAIGDVIAVDTASGVVENLNLRTTQLRNAEGRLIILPNSTINRVENLTRTWSRVDHTITVAANTNANQAIELIQTVAQRLYDDPDFHLLIAEPPQVLGIDQVSHEGILIRTAIKTQPLQQWKVGREFRLRLKNALDEHHIQLGVPQRQVWNYAGDNHQQNGISASPTNLESP